MKPGSFVVINVCGPYYLKELNEIVPFPSRIANFMKEIGYKWKNQRIWDRTNLFKNQKGFSYLRNPIIYSGSYEVILTFEK